MRTRHELQTIQLSYKEICEGKGPWVPLGMFMHDFFGNFVDRREELLQDPIQVPEHPTNDQLHWAAFCAGAVEYLCEKYHLRCPAWVHNPTYILSEAWFVSPIIARKPHLQEHCKRETPRAFAQRNVFCDNRIFANKYEEAEHMKLLRESEQQTA